MKIKILAVAFTALMAIGAVVALNFPRLRFTVHVVDDDGKPVSGVTATFILNEDSSTLDKTTDFTATTDENGNLTVEGYSQYGAFAYRRSFSKDGYYSSGVNIPPLNHEVKDGHWQPWDQTFTTVLRKIGDPIPMYVKHLSLHIPATLNASCGIDLKAGDAVAPYGNGTISDIIVTFTKTDYQSDQNYDTKATISFSNASDGIQEIQLLTEFTNSVFKWPREAPIDGYQPTLAAERLWRNVKLPTQSINTARDDQAYFFRIRSSQSSGETTGGYYGKINGGVRVGADASGHGYIEFTYYLNPTPNDRNLEWDPKRNLAPTPKDVSQQVREP